MSHTARDFSDSGVLDMHVIVCTEEKQVAGEVSSTPGTVISEWLVLEGFSLQGYTQVGVEDTRYLSMFIVYAKEGKKKPIFFIRSSLATLHIQGSS